ncbi:MAG: PGF-pre-PGF domain-containing protein [Methanocellales archaeon]
MVIKRFSFAGLILLAVAASVIALEIQDPFVVYGYVKYSDNTPASQVLVYVSTLNQTKSCITDSLGKYSVVLDSYQNREQIKVNASGSIATGEVNTSNGGIRIDITIQLPAPPPTPSPTPTVKPTATLTPTPTPSPSPTSIPSASPPSASIGSSSSGGGGAAAGEPYENIAAKEVGYIWNISPGVNIARKMEAEEHGIVELSFTYQTSLGEIVIMVEKLRGRSAFVNLDPPGIVYEHVNIWVSIPSQRYLENAIIKFKIEKNWLDNKNVKPHQIALYRYSNSSWHKLNTTMISQSSTHIYYSSNTHGFSPFAIVAELDTGVQQKIILNLTQGWNLISIPLVQTAKYLVNDKIKHISIYDSGIGEYRTYIANFSRDEEDFEVKPGQGLYVYVDGSTSVIFEGSEVQWSQWGNNMNLRFFKGWNLIGIPIASNCSASDFMKAFNGKARYLVRFDASNGTHETYIANFSKENFALEPGSGYWVYLESAAELQLCS